MIRPGWTLSKEFSFEAAHQLPDHQGKCRRLHGHSWRGKIYIHGAELIREGSMTGMVYDFGELNSQYLKPLLAEYLDHHYLNESLQLHSPTCEAVAEWVFNHLQDRGLKDLIAVEIMETCTSAVLYLPPAISDTHSRFQVQS